MNPLRRISDQLREMRWAQVVIELLLLVLGILIALAVDDWMQGRVMPGWSASTCSCLYATCSVTRRS